MTASITMAAVMLTPAALLACSAVTLAMDGKIVLGSNNDNQGVHKLIVTPPRDGLFGRICIARDVEPGWSPFALRCMNDQGVALTAASVAETKTPYDPDKPHFRYNFIERIVAEAASVKQVLAMVKAYTLPEQHGVNVHIMVADRTGASAVIEWVDDELRIVPREGPFQVMTNYFLSKPDPYAGRPTRMARGTRLAAEAKEASVAVVATVLKEMSVHAMVKGKEVGTNESVAWDLTGRRVVVFYKRDFDHPLVLDMDTEMAKEARAVELDKLIPKPVPFDNAWRHEFGLHEPKLPPTQ
jgi:hypothetical protein